MTVQDLIDVLNKIEDKSKRVILDWNLTNTDYAKDIFTYEYLSWLVICEED